MRARTTEPSLNYCEKSPQDDKRHCDHPTGPMYGTGTGSLRLRNGIPLGKPRRKSQTVYQPQICCWCGFETAEVLHPVVARHGKHAPVEWRS